MVCSKVLSFLVLTLSVLAVKAQVEKEWWRTATFYQIYPRSLMDSNGDGIGDIPGIISKMEHLKEIGMDACWLSPVFASPQVDTGYDVSDFYSMEPDYGTMEDFIKLMETADRLGIQLMLDFIPNHTSDKHQWFIESERRNASYLNHYVWRNGTMVDGIMGPPNNWISVFGGSAWTYSPAREQYYLHQFSAQQPDLNYRNDLVVEEMKSVMRFYMDKGVAGFRLDAINHMFEDSQFRDEPRNEAVSDPSNYEYLLHIHTKDLPETFDLVYSWRQFIDEYVREKNVSRDIIIMTEAYASIEDTMRYYGHPTDGRLGAHMPFNFQLIYSFENPTRVSPKGIKNDIYYWLDHMPENKTADWVAGSHDHSRVASRVGSALVNVVNTIVMTLPGASITYYGEEIGMENNMNVNMSDNRNPNRTPMQWNNSTGAGFTTLMAIETWLPINPNYVTLNVEAQKGQPGSTLEYFKKLTTIRKNSVFRSGSLHMEDIDANVLAFTRELGSNGYLVVVNVANKNVTVNLSNFTTIASNITVQISAPNSPFLSLNSSWSKTSFELGPYDAGIFSYEVSAATKTILSLALVTVLLLINILTQ